MNATSTPQVSADVQEIFEELLTRVHGLQAVLISTNDGVPLIEAISPTYKGRLSTEFASADFASVFATAAEQAGKLRFGGVRSITTFLEDLVLVHVSHSPLVLSFIGNEEANVGAMLYLAPMLRAALDSIKGAVQSAET